MTWPACRGSVATPSASDSANPLTAVSGVLSSSRPEEELALALLTVLQGDRELVDRLSYFGDLGRALNRCA